MDSDAPVFLSQLFRVLVIQSYAMKFLISRKQNTYAIFRGDSDLSSTSVHQGNLSKLRYFEIYLQKSSMEEQSFFESINLHCRLAGQQ